MANCYYCGKKFPMFGAKRLPAHPNDVGFDDKALSCEECWRTRVAGIGLTVATGDGKADRARIEKYRHDALNFKKSGDIQNALDNYEKFVELSLKCLGYERGGVSPRVNGLDLDSIGDLHAAVGNLEKARESYQLAIKLFEEAATTVAPVSPLSGAFYAVHEGARKAAIKSVKEKLSKMPPPPPPPN